MKRVALVLACVPLMACSSPGSEPTTDAATGPDPFADAGATGAFGDRASSCVRITSAMNKKAEELGCTLTPTPECPAYVDRIETSQGLAGRCIEYDQGTVATCELRIAAYKACSDFSTSPCRLTIRESKSGSSCADAGVSDAPSEGG